MRLVWPCSFAWPFQSPSVPRYRPKHAQEGLHTLREKVERSFDEALADRGDALAEPGEASGGWLG